MKGRTHGKKKQRTPGTLEHKYKISKSVINGVAPEDIDGGFAWAALLPFLKALGVIGLENLAKPLAEKGINWLIQKIQGKGLHQAGSVGAGIIRSGDKKGAGFIPGTRPGNLPMKVKASKTIYKEGIKPQNLPLRVQAARGGVSVKDLQHFKEQILPLLQKGDIEGFKSAFMSTLKKNVR